MWELANFGNLDQNGNGDLDQDQLTNLFELQNGSNPNSIDANSNHIPDDWELANAGKFAVFPPCHFCEIGADADRSEARWYLWNDTDTAVNHSISTAQASLLLGIRRRHRRHRYILGRHQRHWRATELDLRRGRRFRGSVFTYGFTFPFYGQDHTQVFVSSNGLLCFGAPNTTYDNRALPDPSPRRISSPRSGTISTRVPRATSITNRKATVSSSSSRALRNRRVG